MDSRILMVLLAALGAAAACGSKTEGTSSPLCKGPPLPECSIPVANMSFVNTAVPATDGVSTARVRSSGTGTICMSGSLADAGPTSANWGAVLALVTAEWNDTYTLVSPFNAQELGITKGQVTVENPPATGIAVAVQQLARLECQESPVECLTAAPFYWNSPLMTETRTVTASLADAAQPSWGDPSLALDPTMLNGLQFEARTTQGASFAYDFCVHDLKFLGTDNHEIVPNR